MSSSSGSDGHRKQKRLSHLFTKRSNSKQDITQLESSVPPLNLLEQAQEHESRRTSRWSLPFHLTIPSPRNPKPSTLPQEHKRRRSKKKPGKSHVVKTRSYESTMKVEPKKDRPDSTKKASSVSTAQVKGSSQSFDSLTTNATKRTEQVSLSFDSSPSTHKQSKSKKSSSSSIHASSSHAKKSRPQRSHSSNPETKEVLEQANQNASAQNAQIQKVTADSRTRSASSPGRDSDYPSSSPRNLLETVSSAPRTLLEKEEGTERAAYKRVLQELVVVTKSVLTEMEENNPMVELRVKQIISLCNSLIALLKNPEHKRNVKDVSKNIATACHHQDSLQVRQAIQQLVVVMRDARQSIS